jgi:hypothetical protein
MRSAMVHGRTPRKDDVGIKIATEDDVAVVDRAVTANDA